MFYFFSFFELLWTLFFVQLFASISVYIQIYIKNLYFEMFAWMTMLKWAWLHKKMTIWHKLNKQQISAYNYEIDKKRNNLIFFNRANTQYQTFSLIRILKSREKIVFFFIFEFFDFWAFFFNWMTSRCLNLKNLVSHFRFFFLILSVSQTNATMNITVEKIFDVKILISKRNFEWTWLM